MLDPKKIADADQGMAALKEVFIPSLKVYYDKCIEVGFSKQEAFQLTLIFQTSMLNRNK